MGLRSFLILHRRMGLISAVFVLILAATGIVLHYTNTLGLDRTYIDSPLLLKWYGLEKPTPAVGYQAGDHHFLQIEDVLFMDERMLPGAFAALTGAIATEFGFLIVTVSELILISPGGELIEILGSEHGVPETMSGVATLEGQPVLRSAAGVYGVDVDSLQFSPMPEQSISPQWSSPVTVPGQLAETVGESYAATLISWERLLLDIHSGQLFGSFGRILIDVMAVLFMLMAATGIWIWSRRRPR